MLATWGTMVVQLRCWNTFAACALQSKRLRETQTMALVQNL